MFSSFTMMWYVYTLSYGDIPFYAGMTNNPVERYKRHHYWDDCNTYNLVRYNAVVKNKFCTMSLVYCSEKKVDVENMEFRAIFSLVVAGFSLLNVYGNNHINRDLYPILPTIDRLPRKLFTELVLQHIIDNIRKILKEYGHEKHRHYNMDYSASISRRIIPAYSKRSQLGSKRQNRSHGV